MFDQIPGDLYPGLNQLCKKLSKYVDESGASLSLQEELDEAKKALYNVKTTYFQQLLLYNQLQDILLKNFYGYSDGNFTSSEEKKFFRMASERLGAVQARNFTNISLIKNGKHNRDTQLFGLSENDFTEESEKKKEIHQSLQQVLLPLIEKNLKQFCLELFKIFNPNSKDSEGLQLAKANQLPVFVSNEKQKLSDALKVINKQKKEFNKIFNDNYKILDLSLHELQLKMSSKVIDSQEDAKQIAADWLATKCDYIILKIKVMTNHLYKETYTPETVEALMKIRKFIEEKITKTKDKIQKTKSALSMYQSVDIFNQLLNEYSNLTMEIENKKWALNELQRNKHR
ncbi:uncharacterized protein LOC101241083 isoform X1 [Hydra vulgaris]|uniref:uncharacterized protein LOC101241083 isoform X1 n=1 Tax=Hydra vulgaris TaxID=6087 RepID=UPI001F5FE8F7|nr:AUGMIN subunit 4 [Hydra vulgaris]